MNRSGHSPDDFRQLGGHQDAAWMLPIYRRRVFRTGQAFWIEIRDTLKEEFVADGFPRGKLEFQMAGVDEKRLMNLLVAWANAKHVRRDCGFWEVVTAPALTHRCRLIQICDPCGLLPEGDVAQVWDFVEEPFEYRGVLPSGYTLCIAQDFSEQFVREQVKEFRAEHGITDVRRWGMPASA